MTLDDDRLTEPEPQRCEEPVRVMALRAVDGAGGGADKIILRNASQVNPNEVRMSLCFLRNASDEEFDFDQRSRQRGLDYHEVRHRGLTDTSVVSQLRSVIDVVRPQIIHSHDYKANFFATLLARRANAIRMATSHGWTGSSPRERALYYPADKLLLSRFPCVIAVSDQIRETLIRWGAQRDRVRVLLNGVDPTGYQRNKDRRLSVRQQLGLNSSDIVLGAVGRVERQKRFDVLIDSFVLMRQRVPHLKLLIAGEGALRTQLQDQVDRLHLSDVVTLLGHCSEMRDLYQAFDVLVQSSDYEGTPTVVVEAMAMEIPIVATDVGGTRQLIVDQRHGLLVPPRQPSRICEAVLKTIEDDLATKQRVQAARQRAETDLSFQRRTAELQSLYRQLVRDARDRPGHKAGQNR